MESFADYVQCNRVDARVEWCHVNAKIVQDKEGTEKVRWILSKSHKKASTQ